MNTNATTSRLVRLKNRAIGFWEYCTHGVWLDSRKKWWISVVKTAEHNRKIVSVDRHPVAGMRHDLPHHARPRARSGAACGHWPRFRLASRAHQRALPAFPRAQDRRGTSNGVCRLLPQPGVGGNLRRSRHRILALDVNFSYEQCRRCLQPYLECKGRPFDMAQDHRLYGHVPHLACTHDMRVGTFNPCKLDDKHHFRFLFHDPVYHRCV